jgi:hypothetical protein
MKLADSRRGRPVVSGCLGLLRPFSEVTRNDLPTLANPTVDTTLQESSVRPIAETEPCRMADSIDNLIYAEAQGGLARQPVLFNKLCVRTRIVGCCAAALSPHRKWTFVEGAGALFLPYCRLSWCSRRCAGGSRSRSSVATATSLRRGLAVGVSGSSPRAPSACRARAERTEAHDLRRQVSRLERALTGGV